MELFIFARFHALAGQEADVATAIRGVLRPTSREPGCLAIGSYRSTRDPRLFYIHSRWVDEAAFELHTERRHTVKFVDEVQKLIGHPFEATRTQAI